MPARKSDEHTEGRENRQGEQHVSNRSKAKEGGKDVNGGAPRQRKDYRSAESCIEHWEDEQHLEKNMQEYMEFQEQNRQSAKSDGDATGKRGHAANGNTPNKKQKKNGDEAKGTAGSRTRVPKKGQKVQWHSLPGYVDGEVIEVVYEETTIEGKRVKGSRHDPRVVLKSESSGKICVHKPEVVYFP